MAIAWPARVADAPLPLPEPVAVDSEPERDEPELPDESDPLPEEPEPPTKPVAEERWEVAVAVCDVAEAEDDEEETMSLQERSNAGVLLKSLLSPKVALSPALPSF